MSSASWYGSQVPWAQDHIPGPMVLPAVLLSVLLGCTSLSLSLSLLPAGSTSGRLLLSFPMEDQGDLPSHSGCFSRVNECFLYSIFMECVLVGGGCDVSGSVVVSVSLGAWTVSRSRSCWSPLGTSGKSMVGDGGVLVLVADAGDTACAITPLADFSPPTSWHGSVCAPPVTVASEW